MFQHFSAFFYPQKIASKRDNFTFEDFLKNIPQFLGMRVCRRGAPAITTSTMRRSIWKREKMINYKVLAIWNLNAMQWLRYQQLRVELQHWGTEFIYLISTDMLYWQNSEKLYFIKLSFMFQMNSRGKLWNKAAIYHNMEQEMLDLSKSCDMCYG